jgi:hypothetical protein
MQRVRRAAQRRRLPGVGHRVLERGARAEAGDGAALPAIVRPPVEQLAAHERCAKVRRGCCIDCESCRREGRGGGAGGERLARCRSK